MKPTAKLMVAKRDRKQGNQGSGSGVGFSDVLAAAAEQIRQRDAARNYKSAEPTAAGSAEVVPTLPDARAELRAGYAATLEVAKATLATTDSRVELSSLSDSLLPMTDKVRAGNKLAAAAKALRADIEAKLQLLPSENLRSFKAKPRAPEIDPKLAGAQPDKAMYDLADHFEKLLTSAEVTPGQPLSVPDSQDHAAIPEVYKTLTQEEVQDSLDSLSEQLKSGLDSLTANADVWQPGFRNKPLTEDVRERMIVECTVGFDRFKLEDVYAAVLPARQKEFFKRIKTLARQQRAFERLVERQKQLDTVGGVDPNEAPSTDTQELVKVKLEIAARDRVRAESLAPVPVPAQAQVESASVMSRRERALAKLANSSSGPSDEALGLPDKRSEADLAEQAAAGWISVLGEAQVLIDSDTDAALSELAPAKLETALQALEAETKRLKLAFDQGRLSKLDKVRLEVGVSDGRRERRRLLGRIRKIKSSPVELSTSDLEPINLDIQAKLTELEQGLLEIRDQLNVDVPNVDFLQASLSNAAAKLTEVLDVLKADHQAGFDLGLSRVRAQAIEEDLKRYAASLESIRFELDSESEHEEVESVVRPKTKRVRKPRTTAAAVRPQTDSAQPAIEPRRGMLAGVAATWARAADYIRNGWSRVYKEEILGELSPRELEGRLEAGKSEKLLQVTAGVAGGLASTWGAALVPDLLRWSTQSVAAHLDSKDFQRVILEAVRARQDVYGVRNPVTGNLLEVRLENLRERQQNLLAEIKNLRRLTPELKTLLAQKLETVLSNFGSHGSDVEAEYAERFKEAMDKAVAEAAEAKVMLDAHLISKVSGGKVMREAVNSSLVVASATAAASGAGVALAGLHLARGSAYSLQAVVERYRLAKQAEARGERKSEVTVAKVIKEGFTELWQKIHPSSSIRDKRQAIGTLIRYAGLGGTAVAAGGDMLRQGAEMLDVDELLERALANVKTYAAQVHDKWFGVATPDQVDLPEAPTSGVRFQGEIPVGSRVMGGGQREGITYVLKRVIQNNPEAYGFDSDSDLSAELFAKRLAVQIAQNEGQMRRWLTSEAADKLNLFPEFVDGEWHMSAVVDGHKLSMAELEAEGFTSAAPAQSK